MIVGIIIIIIIILIGGYFILTYNKLVNNRNKVKDQWSQIDVQLKRRADLIPNLVETVKGYAKHEKETLDAVIKARNQVVDAKDINSEVKANDKLSGALTKLFALSESYPDLKANTNFISLQNDLKETEDKISYAREFYNDSVLSFNNLVEMFPSNIIASIFKFTKFDFFQVNEKEKENPHVKF